jgi:hypothetical protein
LVRLAQIIAADFSSARATPSVMVGYKFAKRTGMPTAKQID